MILDIININEKEGNEVIRIMDVNVDQPMFQKRQYKDGHECQT